MFAYIAIGAVVISLGGLFAVVKYYDTLQLRQTLRVKLYNQILLIKEEKEKTERRQERISKVAAARSPEEMNRRYELIKKKRGLLNPSPVPPPALPVQEKKEIIINKLSELDKFKQRQSERDTMLHRLKK